MHKKKLIVTTEHTPPNHRNNNYFKVIRGSSILSVHIFNDRDKISTREAYDQALRCMRDKFVHAVEGLTSYKRVLTVWKRFNYQGYHSDLSQLRIIA